MAGDNGLTDLLATQLIEHLHYRIVDVSSLLQLQALPSTLTLARPQVSTIKELVGRWYGNESRWFGGKGSHRALDDIQGSIEELRHYRETFFIKPPSASGGGEK